MNVTVFGLGYVGSVSAACLASLGHRVIGVDVNADKVLCINSGQSPIVEPGLDALIREGVSADRLRATTCAREAVGNSDLSLICVGTPSNGNGSLNLQFMENACREVGACLAGIGHYHTVVVRSTVLPGTAETSLIPLLERESNRTAGADFGYCMNPEFLREGNAVQDFFDPSQIVIGGFDERSARHVSQLYETLTAPQVVTSMKTAEMVKYVSNAFHALKVAFANEIGNICKAVQADGREVMEIVCRDRRLNVSPAYLKPGFGFGGSCLPKDMRALVHAARWRDLDCPLLESVLESNQQHIQRGIEMVERTGRNRIGVLGLSFKAGTDDVRESPIVPLVETLVGRGYEVRVFDCDVKLENLVGKNRNFVERALPHIASIMRNCMEEVITESEVVVLGNGNERYREAAQLIREGQILIDLSGVAKNHQTRGTYEGICW
jgi:GDP-mannose 6-dehydrogenase